MYKQEKKYYIQAFLYAFLMTCLLLIPFVIIDQGYFVFYGDYNAQQIPFYKTCIRAIQSGNMGWNWQTDLGANFIGSYSFYTLGSPFFWLAALFPVSISQYLMAPLLALKLGLSSLFAFIYIRRFVKKPQSALIGGILYAFSGFSMYNIFFFHFHEAICFFPLLLIGLEEAVVNKRRGTLAAAIALNAFVNYFFFIGECVFLVVYFIVRMCCDKSFRIRVGDFFCLAFECIVGVAIAGALFVPSIYQVLDVPRSTEILTGESFVMFNKAHRYGLLLEAMFFPPEISARNNMFPNAGAEWSSVALYLPLFSVAGAITFLKNREKNWVKTLLIACLVIAFVPGFNSVFMLFNDSYNTRWFYMPTLIICLATVYALENSDKYDFKSGIKISAITVGIMSLLILLHPIIEKNSNNQNVLMPNAVKLSYMVFLQIGIAVVFLIALGIFIRIRRKNPQKSEKILLPMTVVSCILLGIYFIGCGRSIGPYVGEYNKTVNAQIEIDDGSFFRMESIDEINNVNMLWDMSSLKSFTSVIPGSTFDLYKQLGIKRDVNSSPDHSRYALRSMTRVKYLIVKHDCKEEKLKEALDSLKLYEYHSTQGNYDIYINNYAFPMGFTYDSYITVRDFPSDPSGNDKLMSRAVLLTDEQVARYGHLYTYLGENEIAETSLEQFKKDAEKRINSGVADFTVTNSGFTARTAYDTDELLVFSVPYDKGWSATVNGEPADVEKVNGGFCAVYVNKGSSDIEFTYTTPGAKLGLILTVSGTVLLGIYIGVIYGFIRRRQKAPVSPDVTEQTERINAENE